MMCFASRTGTRRNLNAIASAGWGILVSRAWEWRTEGFELWVADNGAWADYQAGRPFQEDQFEAFVDWIGAQAIAPYFIVLPDIVAGGLESLALSVRYLNRCTACCGLVLIAVQDGMSESDVTPFVGSSVGIFLGGSTAWKLANMARWGVFCRRRSLHYHVARVNTARRIRMAHASGADSIDGSSGSRFAVSIPPLDRALSQRDLLAPSRMPA